MWGHTPYSEVFDVDTETYTLLPIELDKNWTVSFFYHEELICLVKYTVYYIIGTELKEKHSKLA